MWVRYREIHRNGPGRWEYVEVGDIRDEAIQDIIEEMSGPSSSDHCRWEWDKMEHVPSNIITQHIDHLFQEMMRAQRRINELEVQLTEALLREQNES